jgi:predicted Fe-Mo cluster-binding NifX family protein
MEIKIALALNNKELFENKHFGEAKIFSIYKYNGDQLLREKILQNPFVTVSGKARHGLEMKVEKIVELLQNHNVSVIVSNQFGKNLIIASKHFVPVRVSGEEPQQVINLLLKYIHWIKDEIHSQPERHKLFTINQGILKTAINKE